MTEGKTQILNLDAELTRAEITYREGTYELRNRSELSIVEMQQFRALLTEYDELTDGDLSDEVAEKLGAALQSIAAVLVVDPPEGGFPDQLCAAILSFWTDQHPDGADAGPPPRPVRKPQDRQPKQRRSTGAK